MTTYFDSTSLVTKGTFAAAGGVVTGEGTITATSIQEAVSTRKMYDNMGINQELKKAETYALILNQAAKMDTLYTEVVAGTRKALDTLVGIKKSAAEKYCALYNAAFSLNADYSAAYKKAVLDGLTVKEATKKSSEVASGKWNVALKRIKMNFSHLDGKVESLANFKNKLDIKKATVGIDI